MSVELYVLDTDHATKIGITTRSTEDRVRDLLLAAALVPRVVRTWEFSRKSDAWEIEQTAHGLLAEDRLDGEWFCTHPLVACAAVEEALKWTPTARAGLLFRLRNPDLVAVMDEIDRNRAA